MILRLAALLTFAAVVPAQYADPQTIARVQIEGLKESSGVVASRRYPGIFWTHNDSGNRAKLFAFDRAGRSVGTFAIPAIRARDWEDIAIGPRSKIYVGDIGDNNRTRRSISIFLVPEPNPRSVSDTTQAAQEFQFTYPDHPHDAEALLVHPQTGDAYIVTKGRGEDSATLVFRAKAPLKSGVLTRVAEIDLPSGSIFALFMGRVTGGDISPDGTRVILSDYNKAFEAVLPRGAKGFDAIWSAKWNEVDMGERKQGEGICYRHDGKAVLATSEGAKFPLIEAVRKR